MLGNMQRKGNTMGSAYQAYYLDSYLRDWLSAVSVSKRAAEIDYFQSSCLELGLNVGSDACILLVVAFGSGIG